MKTMFSDYLRVVMPVLMLLFVGGLLSAEPPATDNLPKSSPSKSEAKPSQTPQLFELRVYTAAPGKMDALHKRFRDHTLRLFAKHGIKSIGYWTANQEPNEERLYYLVAYPDLESREKLLVQGIAVDPEFRQAVAESTQDGPLTTNIESILLTPTDYSPLK